MRLFRKPPKPTAPREFEELLSEHLDALYSSALRFCGGRAADAEDLLHDAVFRAFQHFDELRAPQAARAWLFTILTRTNLNRVRTRQRRAETLAPDLDERELEAALAGWRHNVAPDEYADGALTRQRLTHALDMLDEDVRTVIWLSDVEGFRQREVAEMLGIPEGTVASRLFRARRAAHAVFEVAWHEPGLLHAMVGSLSAAELAAFAEACIKQARGTVAAWIMYPTIHQET